MIIISKEAQDQLQQLKERFGTFKTPKESGRSAFWYWFDQIHNEMQNLEKKNLLNGQLLDTRMKWWGNIIYSKSTVNGETTITVEGFEFDFDKFINWLLHKEKHALPFSICDVCFGVACVLYDKSQKYGLVDSLLQPLVKQKFDDIINFHHSTEDYNKIHAIGFLGNRVYSISQKGDITLLHISKQDYLNKKHRYDESNKRYVGILDYITEQKYNTIYKMKSLQQYISEQMVCELSSDLLKRAYTKQVKRNQGTEDNRARKFKKGVHDALDKEMTQTKNGARYAKNEDLYKQALKKFPLLKKLEQSPLINDWSADGMEKEGFISYYPKKTPQGGISVQFDNGFDPQKIEEIWVHCWCSGDDWFHLFPDNKKKVYVCFKLDLEEDSEEIENTLELVNSLGFHVSKEDIAE